MAGKSDWIVPLVLGGAAAGSAYLSSRSNRRAAEAQTEQDENQDVRDVALRESLADPFRHQRSQAQNLTALDMLRQFGQGGGRRVNAPANVAAYMSDKTPQRFAPSSSLRGSIDALENSIRGGNTAPTMTDPANFGRTSAVNINAATAQPGGPAAPGAAGTPSVMPRTPDSYLPSQEYRRNEGAGGVLAGAAKGFATGGTVGAYVGGVGAVPGAAIGTVAGAIAGAFTKNAKTAKTDLSLEQANEVLHQVYQQELGRDASPEEIATHLKNQGWQPGHKWIGEQGLKAVIANIQSSIEARQRGAVAA